MLPNIKTIVYATTLGKDTRPVFRHAVSLALQYNAHIVMVHALEPLGEFGHALIDSYLPGEEAKRLYEEGHQRVVETMQQRVADFCAQELQGINGSGGLDIEQVVEEDAPAELILRIAEEKQADMIVLGSHSHHSAFGRKLLGDTAQQVSLYAKMPVLLVPNQTGS